MEAQVPPGPGFEELFKCAQTTGQGDKRVCALQHDAFALMHGVDNDQFVAAGMGPFTLDHVLRYHAQHPPSRCDARVGEDSHQPVVATSVNQLSAVPGNPLADINGRLNEGRVCAGAGAAVDAN